MKKRASEGDVQAFMAAVYPDAPNLALALFDERTVLRDATMLILALRAQVEGPTP
jgi:hypothetical protein